MKGLFRQISVVVATIAVIVINYLSVLLPIGGMSTGAVADLYKIYFYPAGYAFSIWGLIYIGLSIYTVWQALPAQKNSAVLDKVGLWYLVASLGNIAWIFAWQYRHPVWSVIPIVVMLVSLLFAYVALKSDKSATTKDKWLVHVPFSLYTGWLSVATIACISAALFSVKWDGFGLDPQIWAVIMMIVAFLIIAYTVWKNRDFAWGLVFIWAITAIGVRFGDISMLYITAYILSGLMAVDLIYLLFTNKK